MGYLPTINALATSIATIYELLCQTMQRKLCDHAFYSKTLDNQQKHQEKIGFVAFIAKTFYDINIEVIW